MPAEKAAVPSAPANALVRKFRRTKLVDQKVRQYSPPPAKNIAAKKSQKRRVRSSSTSRRHVRDGGSACARSGYGVRDGRKSSSTGSSATSATAARMARQWTRQTSAAPARSAKAKVPSDQKPCVKFT